MPIVQLVRGPLHLLLSVSAIIAALFHGCGSGTTIFATSRDGGAGGAPSCALALEPCALDRDCCEGACELGACAICRAAGRTCAFSSSCCSGVCGASGVCR